MKDIELYFHDKVKDRLQDPEVAEKCSDCIYAFMRMFLTADDFRNLVSFSLVTPEYIYLPPPQLIYVCVSIHFNYFK